MKNSTRIFSFAFFLITFFFLLINISKGAGSPIPDASLSSFDSEQLPNYPASYAIDESNSTMWCTQFVDTNPAHPHQIVLDLGKNYLIGGLRYLPRQDGSIPNRAAREGGSEGVHGSSLCGCWADGFLQGSVLPAQDPFRDFRREEPQLCPL